MSKIYMQDTTINSNTNNESIKTVNNISKFNANKSRHNSFKNDFMKEEKNKPKEFKFSLGLELGKEKLEKNYWNKENRRSLARQKTVKMRGMKFMDNKLNIIVNYAYSINDFFFKWKF